MKTIAMIAAAVALSTSAVHAEGPCYGWVQKGNGDLICEVRGPSPSGQTYSATELSNRPGPSTFSPSAYPSAPTTSVIQSQTTIRSNYGTSVIRGTTTYRR